jgi:hypothetical protein
MVIQVLKSGTNASTRFTPFVSEPQVLRNVYEPLEPPGSAGVNVVPELPGQSVVTWKPDGVDVELCEDAEEDDVGL